jgi:Zn-dependent M28 family amino/carboxypeptidase
MKTLFRIAVLLTTSWTTAALAQYPASEREPSLEVKGTTKAVLEEIDKRSELMANLEYLCDMIGPRLTGSANLKRANEWTRDKFKSYGLENVHLEPWKIAHAWTRGQATGRVVFPTEQRLLLEAAGWSPATKGPVRGPVMYVKAAKASDLEPFKGKLKGAWVMTRELSVQPSPKQPQAEGPRRGGGRRGGPDFREAMRFRRSINDFLASEGAAGHLIDSDKEHGLVNMTGATSDFTIGKIPQAFLTTESYGLIWRLLKRGPVEIEIDIKASHSEGEVEVYNTVAEIKGTEKPDEVVIIGGHLDSWDLGTGATDNGTGTMAVLEAARALKAVGAKPRRTIRFILFSGEEQGLHGSKKYVEAHEKELEKVSAVLVHDTGTGKVKSIGLLGRYDLRETLDQVVQPFASEVELEELTLRGMAGGTDHASFYPKGVPAFACVQDPAEYRKTHHTESDTFDKVYADEVNQGAKVLAAWAYNVAMLPELLPRGPKRPSSESPQSRPVPAPVASTAKPSEKPNDKPKNAAADKPSGSN